MRQMGERARRACEVEFDKSIALQKWEKLLHRSHQPGTIGRSTHPVAAGNTFGRESTIAGEVCPRLTGAASEPVRFFALMSLRGACHPAWVGLTPMSSLKSTLTDKLANS
jgi:hypothetical protein